MIITGQVTAGTAPTQLYRVPAGISSLTLTGGSVAAYYGGSGVTTTTGAPLAAGAVVTIPGFATSSGTVLYVVSAAGGAPVGFALSTGE